MQVERRRGKGGRGKECLSINFYKYFTVSGFGKLFVFFFKSQ